MYSCEGGVAPIEGVAVLSGGIANVNAMRLVDLLLAFGFAFDLINCFVIGIERENYIAVCSLEAIGYSVWVDPYVLPVLWKLMVEYWL